MKCNEPISRPTGPHRVFIHVRPDLVPSSGEGLIDRNTDTSDFCVGHAAEMQKVRRGIDDGDVHAKTELLGLGFSSADGEFSAGEGEGFGLGGERRHY